MENAPDIKLSRRSFLGWSAAALGSLIASFLGGTGLVYFISPAFQRKEEDWVDIGSSRDFKPGIPAKVEFIQRRKDAWAVTESRSSAWILTSNGKDFIVFDPRCTHLGCPYRWDQDKKQFLCPCHTAAFGVDGKVISGPPPRPLDRYSAKVAGGRVLILPEPVQEKS